MDPESIFSSALALADFGSRFGSDFGGTFRATTGAAPSVGTASPRSPLSA